jgi:hypothetical protein
MNAEALLRTRVRFSPPSPIHKGQPLSVGLFLCKVPRVCGGFCGSLRTSPPRSESPSRPYSTLSWPFYSQPVLRQKPEVRKHRKSGHYKPMGYSRIFQAVGWRHCLTGGNHPRPTAFRPKTSRISVSVCSICLIMFCAENRAGVSCPIWTETILILFSLSTFLHNSSADIDPPCVCPLTPRHQFKPGNPFVSVLQTLPRPSNDAASLHAYLSPVCGPRSGELHAQNTVLVTGMRLIRLHLVG